jgi:hypothetical protein
VKGLYMLLDDNKNIIIMFVPPGMVTYEEEKNT